MRFRSVDPTTGEVLATFAETPADAVERILARAASVRRGWAATPVDDRAAMVTRLAEALRARKGGLAELMAREMGKPVTEGEAEIEKCARTCEWFAQHGPRMVAPEPREGDADRAYLRFDPLGTILAIMPWNFPFWQFFRCAVPTLLAGNTIVLKHAENVPRCAEAIVALVAGAGAPAGLVDRIRLPHERVEALVADPRIAAVTLTGSTRAGRSIGAAAGRALKKSVLELGGSDAFVVLDDADLDTAARVAVDARLVNGGQSCIAAKRFVVVDAVLDRFVERFVAGMRARRVGTPLERATQVGPLARHDLRDALARQVDASVGRGARCVLGGVVPPGNGAFYPPTVLIAVTPGMAAFDEETFGPVAAIVRAADEAEAVVLANASPYGLGASVWSQDRPRAERIAGQLEAGCVCVNGQVHSDPRLPFGGVKASGYGRELAEYGVREFTNVKSVCVT